MSLCCGGGGGSGEVELTEAEKQADAELEKAQKKLMSQEDKVCDFLRPLPACNASAHVLRRGGRGCEANAHGKFLVLLRCLVVYSMRS